MMEQLSMFLGESPIANMAWKEIISTPELVIHAPRYYQREAVDAIFANWELVRSTLLVMATGTGKTRCITEVIRKLPSESILVLAHRDELLQQSKARIANDCGYTPGLEQAGWHCGEARIVVASVQTMSMEHRLEAFAHDRFKYIIVDEAHHCPSETYQRVINWFPEAKLLGVTATPDRADEKAMGKTFETVAYEYGILQGIKDDFLCDIVASRISIEHLDFSKCRTTAGDLNQGDLDLAMAVEGVLQGVADATIREAGDRRTVVFSTSIANAHRLAEIMNRHRPGYAKAVDGTMNIERRREVLYGHQHGHFQTLCNVGVLTEGYDDPEIACIGMARPTSSRSLYAQCVGRGLRKKQKYSNCLILDYVGNTGKHQLSTPADILGGDDETTEKARKILEEEGKEKNVRSALEEAKAQIEAEKRHAEAVASRLKLKGQALYSKIQVKLFKDYGVDVSAELDHDKRFGGAIALDWQIERMKKLGIPAPDRVTKNVATKLLAAANDRRANGKCTFKQMKFLATRNIDAHDISFETAGELIGAIIKRGFNRPLDRYTFNEIMSHEHDRRPREPGQEG
jgi:superfamily II DNA or RNA helicase